MRISTRASHLSMYHSYFVISMFASQCISVFRRTFHFNCHGLIFNSHFRTPGNEDFASSRLRIDNLSLWTMFQLFHLTLLKSDRAARGRSLFEKRKRKKNIKKTFSHMCRKRKTFSQLKLELLECFKNHINDYFPNKERQMFTFQIRNSLQTSKCLFFYYHE